MERSVLYVAADGSGPAGGELDSPLPSLIAAIHRARILKLERPERGIDIVVRGGTYRVAETIEFTDADAGTESAPLRVLAAPGERVVFTGAVELSPLERIEDESIVERLTPAQREGMRTVRFKEAGIPAIESIAQRRNPPLELFLNCRRLAISRYPKDGWLRIEDVPQDGPKRLHDGLDRERRFNDVPIGRHYGHFIYPGNRPEEWGFHNEVFLHGYWTWDWNDSFQMIDRIDTEERSVYLREPHHSYGYTTNQRFAFLNILEEIDGPGAWCFHRETGRIFLWPVDDDESGYKDAAER